MSEDESIREAIEYAAKLRAEGSIITAAVIGVSLGLAAGYLFAVAMGAAH